MGPESMKYLVNLIKVWADRHTFTGEVKTESKTRMSTAKKVISEKCYIDGAQGTREDKLTNGIHS
jgi:hypothetical protein